MKDDLCKTILSVAALVGGCYLIVHNHDGWGAFLLLLGTFALI